jgi:hypothetical protein
VRIKGKPKAGASKNEAAPSCAERAAVRNTGPCAPIANCVKPARASSSRQIA